MPIVSCSNTSSGEPNYDFFADDVYFSVDNFVEGNEENVSLSKNVYHTLTVKSLSNKHLLQSKIKWSFEGISDYDFKSQLPAKKSQNSKEFIYYLNIRETEESFNINLEYYETSFKKTFMSSNDSINYNVISRYSTNIFYYSDLFTNETAFIFNSEEEYNNLKETMNDRGMLNINYVNINFTKSSLLVFTCLYCFDAVFEFSGLFCRDNTIFAQSLIQATENFDPIVGTTFYLSIDKTNLTNCSQQRLFTYNY